METYLVKEGCGTHIVYDHGELERHLKMGWTLRPKDWWEKEQEARKARRLAELREEQERLEAEIGETTAPRRGRPRKEVQ